MTPSDKQSKPTGSLNPATIAEIRARDRPGVRGYGAKAPATALHLSVGTVAHVCDRIREGGGTGEARPRGCKRLLSEAEEHRIAARLATRLFDTNAELAAMAHDRVRPRTVSDALVRREPPFTRKRTSLRDPEELTPMWKADMRVFLEDPLGHIPWHRRVHANEVAIYQHEHPMLRSVQRGSLSDLSLKTATASSWCASS